MNILINKTRNEMNKPKPEPVVKSFYKYKINDNDNIDHNFKSKYNLNAGIQPVSKYNDNKYNLSRPVENHELRYRTPNFIPDSYYQFNLEGMTHNKMMVNSLQSELGIGNDFNRRLRNDETGETLQEIKEEDDERTARVGWLGCLHRFGERPYSISSSPKRCYSWN